MDVATDQVIDAAAAQSLTADVRRNHALAGWIIVRDQPRPGAFIGRLVTDVALTPYVLVGDILDELRALPPPGLVLSERQPMDPPDLEEIWFVN